MKAITYLRLSYLFYLTMSNNVPGHYVYYQCVYWRMINLWCIIPKTIKINGYTYLVYVVSYLKVKTKSVASATAIVRNMFCRSGSMQISLLWAWVPLLWPSYSYIPQFLYKNSRTLYTLLTTAVLYYSFPGY